MTTPNPFRQITQTLCARTVPQWVEQDTQAKAPSRTEIIRRHLKAERRAMTAQEIAFDLDDQLPNFGSHLVWLLLKHDVKKGRIIFDGRYSWSNEYDTAEAHEIRASVKLLKAHGYKVTAP